MFRQVQIDDVGRFVFGQTKGRDTRDQHVVEVLQEIEGPLFKFQRSFVLVRR